MGDKKNIRKKVSIFDDEDFEEIEELEELEELEEKPKRESSKKEEKSEKKDDKDSKKDSEEELDEKKSSKKEENVVKPSKKKDDEEDDDNKDDKKSKKEEKTTKKVEREDNKKKNVAVKKEVRKSRFEEDDEEDDEDSSLGVKIVLAIVVIAIIVVLLLKSCNKTTNEYSVTFDTNGGTRIADIVVAEDDTINKPADPTKEGYEFVGWYYNDEIYDFSKPVTGNIQLEARWAELANVAGVTLDQTTVKLSPGGTTTLVATVTPENAQNKSLTWVSSNTNIVTVDNNGNVTAVKEGTATVTVTTVDGNFTAEAKITVSSDVVAVTGVTLNKTSLNLGPNESSTLTATVKPSKASNKGVTWSSSDTSVATVSSNGKVTAKKDGTAVITVTTKDGSFTATCNVTVKTVKVTGVRVSTESVTVKEGKTTTVTATVAPTNATNKDVTWKSADTSIAKVSSKGVITGVKEGTTEVTVTTEDGSYSKTVKVTVKAPVIATGVSISGKTEVQEGSTITLKATVTPSDADNKSVTWESSDKSIATVTSAGKVKGVKAGTVTITATSKSDPNVKATWEVTVKEKPKTYSYKVTTYKADENSTEYTRVKVYNENGKDVTENVTATSVQGTRIQIVEGYIQTTASLGANYKGTITVTVNGNTYNATKK